MAQYNTERYLQEALVPIKRGEVLSDCYQSKRRLLRTRAAAEYLGKSVWSIRQLVQSGELPIVRGCDECNWHFDICDLDRYINEHRENFVLD